MGNGLDILLFALVAAFLIFRLRSVLGSRTGNEKQRPDPFTPHRGGREEASGEPTNVIHLPERSKDESGTPLGEEPLPEEPAHVDDALQAGMVAIASRDRNFDPDGFVNGARTAFEMIVRAFADGDKETLEPLLAPDVFANFAEAIDSRKEAGETLETRLLGINAAEPIEAELAGSIAKVTVKFVSQQINVTTDAHGEVVEGDPDLATTVTDLWTFARDTRNREPNWFLVATASPG